MLSTIDTEDRGDFNDKPQQDPKKVENELNEQPHKNRKKLIIFAVCALIAIITAVTWYYRVPCEACSGVGTVDCSICKDGTVECTSCTGGKVECPDCLGEGKPVCKKCEGRGRLEDGQGKCPLCDGLGILYEICKDCHGIKQKIVYNNHNVRWITCPTCNGAGETTSTCRVCEGKKTVTNYIDCPDCKGQGYFDEECTLCGGKGEIVCSKCKGSTRITCTSCGGDHQVDCQECGGSGKKNR